MAPSTSTVRPADVGWRELTAHRPLAVFATLMAVLVVVSTTGVLMDDRYLAGAPVWLKPLKFGMSFLIYAISLAWVVSRMGGGRTVRRTITVFVAASIVELGLITTQAARGVESHFNRIGPVDRVINFGMAGMVLVLWTAMLVVAVLAMRWRFGGDPALISALRWGLVMSVVGAAFGFLMLIPTSAQVDALRAGMDTLQGAHTVGAPHGGPGMALTGWSTESGDLRIPHFVGIHALQALPLFAALLTWPAMRVAEHHRLGLVRLATIGYAGFTAIVLVQALRGVPLLAPDATTIGSAVALVVALGVGTAAVLRTPVTR